MRFQSPWLSLPFACASGSAFAIGYGDGMIYSSCLRALQVSWVTLSFVLVSISPAISPLNSRLTLTVPGDGLGLHLWTIPAGELSNYFRVSPSSILPCQVTPLANIKQHVYVTNMSYCASATFIKLAILFQYLRLFAETASTTSSAQYRLARRVTQLLIVFSTLWGLCFFLLAVFPCTPIDKDWYPSKPGTCIGWGSKHPDEFFAMFAGHSASNMILDLLVLCTPIPFLGMLRIAGKSKAGLITLFTLGIV
jgi:hypothetical protein